jgi:hypothetical protein
VIRPISRNRLLESLKEAASWPGADTGTLVTLAGALVTARADAEGSSYFQELSDKNPANATALALAGFFQVRAGHDVASAIDRLDAAATMDVGLPQYFRGLALAELLPDAGPSDERPGAADTCCSGATRRRLRRCGGRASARPGPTDGRCSRASR